MNNVLASFAGFGDFDAVLMSPDQNNRVTACLRALAAHPNANEIFASTETITNAGHDDYWPAADSWQASLKPYVVKQGVLHVPVKGVLLHNFPYSVGSYATGYYYIQKAIERGLGDPDVRGIALVCDSPGGHVAGCFELVDRIYEWRSQKPIAAFAHEHAYSAAYAIASAASRITVSRTGGVGSIGVVTMHMSWAGALEQAGVEITFVYAGKHKIDGNPYQALSEDAQKRMQARIDATYDVFVGAVARNRKLPEAQIRKTEALTFVSAEAVDRGLADKVGPLDEALADFSVCLLSDGDVTMATQEPKAGIDQAAHDEAVRNAAAQAAKDAKARIVAIKALDEAKERPAAAEAFAMDTDLPLEQVKTMLGKLPVEKAAATTTESNAGNPAFEKAMAGQTPGPGAGGGEKKEELSEEARDAATAARILASAYGSAAKAN